MTVWQTPFRPVPDRGRLMRTAPILYAAEPLPGGMSKPLVVSIPHRLGRDEALRRFKNGLGSASANFGHVFKIQEEIWTGPHLQALGQMASGSIDVAEDYVRLEVFLPWLLAKLAETLQPLIRKEGTLLLEKK
jgi:Putative polyhydroxyalkanoic acid system protein (PHA_gran_rgn)